MADIQKQFAWICKLIPAEPAEGKEEGDASPEGQDQQADGLRWQRGAFEDGGALLPRPHPSPSRETADTVLPEIA